MSPDTPAVSPKEGDIYKFKGEGWSIGDTLTKEFRIMSVRKSGSVITSATTGRGFQYLMSRMQLIRHCELVEDEPIEQDCA